MKNRDIVRLYNVLQHIRNAEAMAAQTGTPSHLGVITGRFSVYAAYNLSKLRAAYDAIQASLQGPWNEVINAFVQDQAELLKRHIDLPAGQEIDPNRAYTPRDLAAYHADFEELKAKHPGIDEALEAKRTSEEILEHDSTVEIRKVGLDHLPQNLSLEEGDFLLEMVDFGDKPAEAVAA